MENDLEKRENSLNRESELNRGDGERNGGDNLGKKRAKQDHHNYVLRDGRFVVKHGITTDPNQRVVQMENEGKQFTSMIIDPVAVSEETARKREEERVEAYQKNHKGKKPRYNK